VRELRAGYDSLVNPSGIEIGFRLDRQWHRMRGEMDRSRRSTLLLLADRRSKRTLDLADAQALLELDPGLASELSAAERAVLDRLP
jgi:hypothetical protein